MRLLRRSLLLLAPAALAAALFPVLSTAATLNEAVFNDVGTDTHEFIEICGSVSESLDGLTVVIIEGEPTGCGVIDRVISLNGYTIGASGLFVIGTTAVNPDLTQAASFVENGSQTVLLVRDYTGQTVGTDIDPGNDGVADFPIGTIVDGFGIIGALTTADLVYYGVTVIGPDGTYDPAGVARCDDCDGTWGMICLNGTEPAPIGIACALPTYIVEFATPGALNCPPIATESKTWGSIKSLYN